VAFEISTGGRYFIAFGNFAERESPRSDMSSMPPVFSPDSRHIFYVLQDYRNGTSTAFVSDVETGTVRKSSVYETIGHAAVSPDGSQLAYAARQDGQDLIVTCRFADEGVLEEHWPAQGPVGDIIHSSDTEHTAYVIVKEDAMILTVYAWSTNRHSEVARFDRITAVKFSDDGRAVLYAIPTPQGMDWRSRKIR
jgi:hypothetical protein